MSFFNFQIVSPTFLTSIQLDEIVAISVRTYDTNPTIRAMTGGNKTLYDPFLRSVNRELLLEGKVWLAVSEGFNNAYARLTEETKYWWQNIYGPQIKEFMDNALGETADLDGWMTPLLADDPPCSKKWPNSPAALPNYVSQPLNGLAAHTSRISFLSERPWCASFRLQQDDAIHFSRHPRLSKSCLSSHSPSFFPVRCIHICLEAHVKVVITSSFIPLVSMVLDLSRQAGEGGFVLSDDRRDESAFRTKEKQGVVFNDLGKESVVDGRAHVRYEQNTACLST
ncbi:uncharacterized protein BT62DRAFT_1078539 [Guyanagaster necrorhizus]|uniref:Uncharacterized protein n=1 Tax=Guyanagaster necrorhizus TaxID=856835 RepID=A0A9P7VMR7_9AGAR|nr:uncharacterized protein BT62DRAFT_1078539 [Guyanagaster necrorhizus MCA 3950]KAG7443477.1 hypothetical protein BT62DRAFT_1078539 [Guyanagaster necrorhizus MCA 3950]